MLVVALTGGIGSGKTAVSDMFAQLGAQIIDTDRIAREIVEPGEPALEAIRQHFGEEVLNPDGSLNRTLLRARIFNHHKDRVWLEHLLHPMIRKQVKEQLAKQGYPYAVIVIPLFTTTTRQEYPFIDRICVVDCEENLQVTRTQSRDGITQDMAKQIIATQIPRQERLALADDVVTNNLDLSALKKQIIDLHIRYLEYTS